MRDRGDNMNVRDAVKKAIDNIIKEGTTDVDKNDLKNHLVVLRR